MNSDPRHQQKEGTNQDTSLINNDESLIDNNFDESNPSTSEKTEDTENTSLTQLTRDDGEITPDFTDGDDPGFEAV